MWRSLLLSALISLAACHGGEQASAPPPLPTVSVIRVAPQTVTPHIPVAGVLAPLPGKDVKVGALVSGRVDRVFVAEGDRVRRGQPLAHVEAQPLREHLSEAEAAQNQTQAALDNARTRLHRTERLWKDGIASRQEVDDARAALVGARSALEQARASGGIAAVQLGRATLRAPFDGVVAAVLVPAGQPVDGAATPVIEVADTRLLDLRAPVPARLAGDVHVGEAAALEVEGVGSIKGVVATLAPLVDIATNTVLVRVRIDNAEGRLRGGMFAHGAILGTPRRALAIPRSALLPGDGGSASEVALVTQTGTVSTRPVVLGSESGGDVEVRAGLAPGDRLIVAGGYALPAGSKVNVAVDRR